LRIRVLLVVATSIALVAPAAAQQPPKSLLPRMVIPDASLARLGSGLRQKSAFFSTPADAAASTPDPNDTGADLKRRGRLAGYVRGRNATGAFSRRAPKGLLAVATSVGLWRDAQAAAASIERDIADFKRFRGKAIEGGLLVSFSARKVPSLGDGAALLRERTRPKGGTDRFITAVVFRVRSLRGNVAVVRGDRTEADAIALRLAPQLRRRMLAALNRN
jgi:hypothetical protein